MCVCWGNLAGPVDDGRVMRWSRAVEIRPVCPQRLPPTRHTHTDIHTHTLKATSINTPPSPPTHQTTPQCHLLSHQHTHHTLTNPPPHIPILSPPINPLIISATVAAISATNRAEVNEAVPVVAPGAAVRFLPGVNTFVP